MTTATTALIAADEWLGGIIGHPVFRLNAVVANTDVDRLPGLIRGHAAGQRRAMYYAKVPTDRIDVVQAIATTGFSVVDVNVTLWLTRDVLGTASQIPVADLADDQADAVLDIAGSCFRYSRFHLDPQVPDAVAHEIKREWIGSYVRRMRGDALIVATLDGRPVGFLAAMWSGAGPNRSAVIDLVGVAGHAQRRGVGRALVQAFIRRYRDHARELRVGTQVANIPSIRMYEQLGFSVSSSEYVLHSHVGSPA